MSEAVEGAEVMLYWLSKKCTFHSAACLIALTLTDAMLGCFAQIKSLPTA